jgi:hypothetical protein
MMLSLSWLRPSKIDHILEVSVTKKLDFQCFQLKFSFCNFNCRNELPTRRCDPREMFEKRSKLYLQYG